MTNQDYHNAEGISSSDFRLLDESPLHLANKKLFKLEGSQFILGSLVHKMVLEPDDIGDEFIKGDFEGADINKDSIAYREAEPLIEALHLKSDIKKMFIEESFNHDDLNKNTKLYKESKKEFVDYAKSENLTVVSKDVWKIAFDAYNAHILVGDRTIITVAMWDQAERMANNITAIAGGLFQNGKTEESFFVDDPIYKVKRKCRPDYYREDLKLCIDVKTTQDGQDYGFSKSVNEYKYHRQAAWYLDTLQMAGKVVDRFIFVTVESRPPHMVRVNELDLESINIGRENYELKLSENLRYLESGQADIVKTISLPEWAKNREEY